MASAARGVTRVLILADAPVLRRGVVSMVNETAGMQSVGTPGELRRALTLVETARPDAVVVELGSGRAATLNACRDLRRRFPRVTIVAIDRKSTRLNSSHANISYAVFCLKKKTKRWSRTVRL